MIICFNCDSDTKNALDNLISTKQYVDYADVIKTAIKNLEVLQGEIADKGTIIIDQDSKNSNIGTKSIQIEQIDKAKTEKIITNTKPHQNYTTSIPTIFSLNKIENINDSFALPPDDMWFNGQNVPLERWIFGQYNKVLPIKASCRALANLLTVHLKGIPLDEALSQIPAKAEKLGDYLLDLDKKLSHNRDESLSTAFPISSHKYHKARSRFSNQFLVNRNKSGQLSGLLLDYKLVNYKNGKKTNISLTKAGFEFSQYENPLFDYQELKNYQKFSEAELSFLIKHIKDNVPSEAFSFTTILKLISEGFNNPEKLDKELIQYISENKRDSLKVTFVSTQRSGAISRMTDLNLISKSRDGIRVSYECTKKGTQFIQQK